MKLLAIDPGYERLGIAVIEKEKGGKEKLIFSECFQTSKNNLHEERLFLIGQEISRIIKRFEPSALAIENLFLNTNQKTAMRVAETKGVILYEAKKNNLLVCEFSPPQIKLAVSGNGRADKKSIIKMIPLLVKMEKELEYDDEYDAIAVGLTFFATQKMK